ncbi:hypothetical protein ABG768_012379 [Culter alburnus]|uniref:Uncharacterized protein n=1 Tax=Culter alburnus TaxID=194366 RepID=A0AAW1ZA01_CULAL
MPSRLNPAKPLILLPCIIYCANCAALPQTCIQCSLSCDGAPELEQHESVLVLIRRPSYEDLEEIQTVSSLYDGGRCSVPGCFQRDTMCTLKIYTHDNRTVPKVLIDKTDLQPACDPEAISDKSKPDGADGNLSNKLLILLAALLWRLLPP